MTKGNEWNGPIFVVGMPRSGTKLLRGLLNGHSKIGIPLNETEFLPYLERHWARFGDLSQHNRFKAFYKRMSETYFFKNRLRENSIQIKEDHWYRLCDRNFSLSNVFEQLIRDDPMVREKVIFGDKSPSYTTSIPVLKGLYPEGKIIHIIRDVRDYVLSVENVFGKNRRRAAQRWVCDVQDARQASTTFKGDVLEVYYERLTEQPIREMKTVCQFLGIEFETGMLNPRSAIENSGSTKGKMGIVSGNYGKYKSQMTRSELNEIESISYELLKELGYECKYTGELSILTTMEMRMLQVLDGVSLIRKDAHNEGWVTSISSRMRQYLMSRR